VPTTRRLAAITFTDTVGYTASTQANFLGFPSRRSLNERGDGAFCDFIPGLVTGVDGSSE
jgi:hypothetical protein